MLGNITGHTQVVFAYTAVVAHSCELHRGCMSLCLKY